jgi:hypothetical protein
MHAFTHVHARVYAQPCMLTCMDTMRVCTSTYSPYYQKHVDVQLTLGKGWSKLWRQILRTAVIGTLKIMPTTPHTACTRVSIHMYACVCASICMHACVYPYVCMRVCIHIYPYVCMRVCIHMYACVCASINICGLIPATCERGQTSKMSQPMHASRKECFRQFKNSYKGQE